MLREHGGAIPEDHNRLQVSCSSPIAIQFIETAIIAEFFLIIKINVRVSANHSPLAPPAEKSGALSDNFAADFSAAA
ncbi:MAG: hypothetical protein MPK62_11115, partial [Alphaproteobacteria bacterium]|nr:hypothetical protein [Alphaproteobacteria bacterium]